MKDVIDSTITTGEKNQVIGVKETSVVHPKGDKIKQQESSFRYRCLPENCDTYPHQYGWNFVKSIIKFRSK